MTHMFRRMHTRKKNALDKKKVQPTKSQGVLCRACDKQKVKQRNVTVYHFPASALAGKCSKKQSRYFQVYHSKSFVSFGWPMCTVIVTATKSNHHSHHQAGKMTTRGCETFGVLSTSPPHPNEQKIKIADGQALSQLTYNDIYRISLSCSTDMCGLLENIDH